MKIVIAPDTFKECLPAAAVAAAMAEGVRAACADAEIDVCPMADGGGGTVEAMVAAAGGEVRFARVHGPFGDLVTARWGLLAVTGPPPGTATPPEIARPPKIGTHPIFEPTDEGGKIGCVPILSGGIAVIEMAEASGLHLLAAERRDPMVTTTYGTGELIAAALEAGAGEIVIGIGGSATVDGGCGCAQALGVRFLDAGGRPCVCGLAGGGLASIADIDMAGRDARLAGVRIRVACDVTNPLTGPSGAAAVYGPQKGATAEMVERLDAGLAHLAEVIRRRLGVDVERMSGAGAAGGLGAGLVALLGARLERGVEIVADAVGLRRRLAGADLVLTGEGKLDGQSLSGKTAVGVARMAAEAGAAVVCIPGRAELLEHGGLFADVLPLVRDGVTATEAMRRARELLVERSAEAVRRFSERARNCSGVGPRLPIV